MQSNLNLLPHHIIAAAELVLGAKLHSSEKHPSKQEKKNALGNFCNVYLAKNSEVSSHAHVFLVLHDRPIYSDATSLVKV